MTFILKLKLSDPKHKKLVEAMNDDQLIEIKRGGYTYLCRVISRTTSYESPVAWTTFELQTDEDGNRPTKSMSFDKWLKQSAMAIIRRTRGGY